MAARRSLIAIVKQRTATRGHAPSQTQAGLADDRSSASPAQILLIGLDLESARAGRAHQGRARNRVASNVEPEEGARRVRAEPRGGFAEGGDSDVVGCRVPKKRELTSGGETACHS